MNNRNLLFVGGGYADIPLIQSAKNLGFHVVTTGNRPEEMGHQYADKYIPADFSDPEIIFELAHSLNLDAICSCCNDFSALSAAYAAEKLGLPGHDSFKIAKILHHKDHYRIFAIEHNINTPKAFGASNTEEALNKISSLKFPVIIKPVDLTGGKGISVIQNPEEARESLDRAFSYSKCKRVVLEEYLSGSRHGFSAFLLKGRIAFHFTDDEYYYLNPYLVSAASTPGSVSDETISKLCQESEKIARILNLKDGIFHVQYILHNDEPFIIEICRRAPGDLYIRLVEIATGVDYPSLIVSASCGLDIPKIDPRKPRGYFTRHCVMASREGRVKEITMHPDIKNSIIEKVMWGGSGSEINDPMKDKLGIIFLKFDSHSEMVSKTKEMQELIKVIID